MQSRETLPDTLSYRVVVVGVPMEFPLPTLANCLLPNPATHASIQSLSEEHSVGVIAHKLHIFKEKLPSKFGHVDYYLQSSGSEMDLSGIRSGLQALFLRWVSEELDPTLRIAVPGASVRVVGVESMLSSCYSNMPLIHEVEGCPLVQNAKDPLKVCSFLCSKMRFEDGADVATLPLKGVSMVEFSWLRTLVPRWPEVSTSASLLNFFKSEFHGVTSLAVRGMDE